MTYDEKLCVQYMNDEPLTVNLIYKYIKENNYELNLIDK